MVIADRYELVGRLGRGGMGEVWQARDLSLNVDVAVKSIRMHPQDTTEPHRSALAYARKEAQHAAALRDHPNIVAVHDVVEHEGLPWTVMRLVRGQSVAELLEDEPHGLSVELIDRIARGVLAALAAAHGVGITHRDIKPPNVMITDGGDVLVTDFGIARHNADTKITMTGSVVGTAAYVAPERLKGVESPAGDLWSLGVTLYQMASGVSPFDRGSVLSTIHAVSHDQPDEPVGAGHLTVVIMALLDKDPATRPGIDAVLHMLNGTEPPSRTKVLPRAETDRRGIWLRPALSVVMQGKKLGLIVTGVAVVAAIGVGAAVGLSGDSGEQEAKPAAKQGERVAGFCTGGAKNWDARAGMCNIAHVAGCQNQKQMMDINNKLAKENPIGSSGYHSDTPVIPLLQQLTTLTERALNQPHVPAPIKTALQKQAEDLKKETDLYKTDGDWSKVDLQRGLKHSPNMACIDFVADLAERGSSSRRVLTHGGEGGARSAVLRPPRHPPCTHAPLPKAHRPTKPVQRGKNSPSTQTS